MGVKGLMKYLKRLYHLPEVSQDKKIQLLTEMPEQCDPIPERSTFLVDGFGLVFSIASEIKRQYQGVYDGYEKDVRAHLQWFKDHNIDIIIIFDGKHQTNLKASTKLERIRGRENNWLHLLRCCDENHPLTVDDVPDVELKMSSFNFIIEEMGIPSFMADGEAELEIALLVRAHNQVAAKERFFAYTSDTDLAIMRDCPTVFFGHLFESPDHLPFAHKIFRRAQLAHDMELSEEMLIEFCLSIGNDFTNQLDKKTIQLDLVSSVQRIHNHDVRKFLQQFKLLRPQPVFSFDIEAEKCLQYGRLFYTGGYVEPDRVRDEFVEPDEVAVKVLSKRQKKVAKELAIENRDILLDALSFGLCFVHCVHENVDFAGMFSSDLHIIALTKMLTLLNSDTPDDRNEMQRLMSLDDGHPVLCKPDLLAAWNFQSVLSRALKYVDNRFAPSRLFNGVLFHFIMNELKGDDEIPGVQPKLVFPNGLFTLERLLASLDAHVGGAAVMSAESIAATRVRQLMREYDSHGDPLCISSEMKSLQLDVMDFIIRANAEVNRGIVVYCDKEQSNNLDYKYLKKSPHLFDVVIVDHLNLSEQLVSAAPSAGKTKVLLVVKETNRQPASIPYVSCVIDAAFIFNFNSGLQFVNKNIANRRLGQRSGRLAHCKSFCLAPIQRFELSSIDECTSLSIFKGYDDVRKYHFPKGVFSSIDIRGQSIFLVALTIEIAREVVENGEICLNGKWFAIDFNNRSVAHGAAATPPPIPRPLSDAEVVIQSVRAHYQSGSDTAQREFHSYVDQVREDESHCKERNSLNPLECPIPLRRRFARQGAHDVSTVPVLRRVLTIEAQVAVMEPPLIIIERQLSIPVQSEANDDVFEDL